MREKVLVIVSRDAAYHPKQREVHGRKINT